MSTDSPSGWTEEMARIFDDHKIDVRNYDANYWAEEFIKAKERNNWTLEDIDFALMIGWFANYRFCVQDAIKRNKKARD